MQQAGVRPLSSVVHCSACSLAGGRCVQVQMHLCTGQHTNIVELRALCQHEAALYMVMVRSSAA